MLIHRVDFVHLLSILSHQKIRLVTFRTICDQIARTMMTEAAILKLNASNRACLCQHSHIHGSNTIASGAFCVV